MRFTTGHSFQLRRRFLTLPTCQFLAFSGRVNSLGWLICILVFLSWRQSRRVDIFFQDTEVEPMIEKYNGEYKRSDITITRITGALQKISDLNLPADSMWFRKSNFFTLVSELVLSETVLRDDLSTKLLQLEDLVMKNKNTSNNEYGVYYSYMYQGTNNRKARVTRSSLFRKFCTYGQPSEAI